MFTPPTTKNRIMRKSLRTVLLHEVTWLFFFLHCLSDRTIAEIRLIRRLRAMKASEQFAYKYFTFMEDYLMAKNFDWTFVEIKVLASEKKDFLEWVNANGITGLEAVDDITELGYKVSISYVDSQNSYVVSVSGKKDEGMNQKLTVSSWSGNLEEACCLAGYKILHIARDGDWTEYETDSTNWG